MKTKKNLTASWKSSQRERKREVEIEGRRGWLKIFILQLGVHKPFTSSALHFFLVLSWTTGYVRLEKYMAGTKIPLPFYPAEMIKKNSPCTIYMSTPRYIGVIGMKAWSTGTPLLDPNTLG
jgi:hypothetical protein